MNKIISKKTYITENIQYMNKDTKIILLSIIMNYIDNADETEQEMDEHNIILSDSGAGVYIDLDKLDQSTIQYIYDVIYRRMTVLNTTYIEGVKI